MATFVALYETPDDVEGFDEYYQSTHLPIVRRYPGATDVRVTRFSSSPRGAPAAFHLMTEVTFETDEEMAAALRSDAGAESARDAKAMAERFGVAPTMLLGAPLAS